MNATIIKEIRLKAGVLLNKSIHYIFPINFDNAITVIVGDNGAGKSTLLESIAVKLGCNPEGGGKNFSFSTEATHSDLHNNIIISKGYRKEKDIFFYRAETFYNLNTEIRRLDSEGSFDPEIKTYYGGKDLHSMSHGEAMEALYQNRFKPDGIYILDEPEASLHPIRQLSFVIRIAELAKQGSQFIIATHSPIIMSIPSCDLRHLHNGVLEPANACEMESYSIYKAVINSDGRYLERLLSDDE
ncbi:MULTISPECIES: AAA family ATPase [unclassified Pseudomonas]|uniref:AAA family ATPase n=1 Tax=unclassified Pseudomonas TaxID=196821 RepID=UPI002ACB0805|nr:MULTISPECIES: AAA family ATPase [unclassified Pseudomonas]MEB0041602.1 AAA family ATPase [Pseudomonas sp. MH10]MEB0092346.1 AAA family ATPase [Pseudomonas sp. CCI4.2]MEB0123254.1 AAA family ATPase [Pseudomonas sp. CCI1.2]WPX55314.1 AAA family ATPase [Pseudomonas sp. CCI4.2]WPX62751.1 AAA family ATPase [Pseudomonas sp. MH10]